MKIDAPFTDAAVGDIFGAMAPIVPSKSRGCRAC
jgi:hypothetical protein